jgi:hypothetical protein
MGRLIRPQCALDVSDDPGVLAQDGRARHRRLDHQHVVNRLFDQRRAEPLCLCRDESGGDRADEVGRRRFHRFGHPLQCDLPTIATSSLEDRIAAQGAQMVGGPDAARRAFVERQPLGRLGTAEEVAALAVYLAADESAFTTGATHVIDGGFTL